MTEHYRSGWTRGLVALAAIVVLCLPAVAGASPRPLSPAPMVTLLAATGSQPFATLEASRGKVSVIRLGRSEVPTAAMPLQLDDIIVTRDGRATVRFTNDGTVLRIGPDSRVQINESAGQRDVTVFFGRLWAHVVKFKEQTTRFATSSTIAAIRGTEISLGVAVDGDETQLSVLEGQVEAQTDAGSLMVEGGQTVSGKKGKAPARSFGVKPADAVQWSLYYLPVLYTAPGELGAGQPWQGKATESTTAYLAGDLGGALTALEGIADADVKDARFFTYRASLALASGSVDKANADIEKALALAPKDSDALALQSTIAVARNQSDRALSFADRAVAADPRSAAAQIARSYALQSKFDLEGARACLDKAVELDPGDALAWARLAELRSALGDRDGTLAAAQKAAELEPGLSRTQSVLGFAHLTRVEIGEARQAFDKAIALDQDDPLPRLGLGLAKIRDGQLDEGSRDLEVAVSLDPGQSLVRSYLGKAYFEDKREGLDEREYELAKGLDPNDPTPWLYDAITKQTTNRPVEALDSLEKAIELNDNRAVYRSRMMLDSDLAARSASLGRVYSDLGFQNVALVEGWNSVNLDPANFSSHRLLADSYAVRPRHEIARVSELFQSQMLQPLNTTPIQPALGESNLFLIAAQGPGALSFNEFNPLFNRDQVNVQGGLMAGEDSTMGGELIVSGIAGRFSYSLGYSMFDTDGYRENNGQDDTIANAFFQFELSPRTSLQAEVRYRDTEAGDLEMRFDENDYSPYLTQASEGTNYRVGLRHDFGPSTTLLASYMHADKDVDFAEPIPDFLADFNVGREEKSDSVEAQLLFGGPRFRLVAGAGYFDVGLDETVAFSILDPDFGFTDITTGDTTVEHTNLYAYAYWSLTRTLTLTLGASGDYYEESGRYFSDFQIPGVPPGEPVPIEPPPVLGERDQFNPKVGLSWSLASGTTLRAAWFEALKRTLITDQTLEPTQVAGFNQFFDDASATASEVWGAAIDQKFGSRVFGGLEYTERDLTIPQTLYEFEPVPSVTVEDRDGQESLARAYLFAALSRRLTVGLEYQYEEFDRDPALQLSYRNVTTERVPLSIRYFHPSGFGAFVAATYLMQDGEFLTFDEFGESVYVPGEKDFWTIDAGLRYRLPKRFGFLVVGANNITDEEATYESTDPKNLGYRPGRFGYARVVVAFP